MERDDACDSCGLSVHATHARSGLPDTCQQRWEKSNEPSASAVPDEFLAPTVVRGEPQN